MNPIQKAYDSYDKNMKLLKLTNSYYHYRNLELIRNRKSPKGSPQKLPHKRRDILPFKDYYIMGENRKFGEILKEIDNKKVKANMNLGFIERGEKMRNFRKQYKLLFDNDLQKRNEDFAKRIMSQGPFINSREVDKEYNSSHPKVLKKLKKIGNESIVLPKITGTRQNPPKNPMLYETSKYYKTSGNQSNDEGDFNNSSGKYETDQRDKENYQDSSKKKQSGAINQNNQSEEIGYHDEEDNENGIKEEM